MKNAWTLEDLYRSIARGWLLLVACALAFAVIALGAFQMWPQKFEATAMMTVEPLTVSSTTQGTGSGVNMETERVVATSSEVLALAAKELGATTISELSDGVVVSVPKGSQVLAFTVTAEDPMTAAQQANAIANAYSERRVANAEAVVADAITFLSGRIAELETQLATTDPTSENTQTLQTQIASLQNNQASLTSTTFYSGALISPAVEPSSSTRPSLPVFVAGGLFIGLFLGSFCALLYGRRRLRASAEEPEVSEPEPVTAKRPMPGIRPTRTTPDRTTGDAKKTNWVPPRTLILGDDRLETGADRSELILPRSGSTR
ncbi:uncharacterized protein involved in exopolysaccharide biosynthesis [Mycetocola sp. CAN_C7]|uniref:hypothetical protein n=1 Tax=Mycetocola sp. CAN_C7 TaxID=2787724 RepID=UPI0018C9A109